MALLRLQMGSFSTFSGRPRSWLAVLILVCGLCNHAGAAEPSLEWESALKFVTGSPRMESRLIGYSGQPSKTYEAAEYLVSNTDDVVTLLTHENPVVRGYAIILAGPRLSLRELYPIFLRELNERVMISTLRADISDSEFVADIFFDVLVERFTPAQREEVIEWLFSHDNEYRLTRQVLAEWPVPDRFHTVIRNRASSSEDYLRHVAAWKNQTDVDLIASWRKKSPSAFWNAVKVFPHPSFSKFFAEYFESESERVYGAEGRDFFGALFQYPSAISTPLLDRIVNELTDDYRSFKIASSIAAALYEVEDTRLADLDFLIWEKHNFISLKRWELLVNAFPDRVRKANLASIRRLEEIRSPFPEDMEKPVLVAILQHAVSEKSEGYLQALTDFVRHANYETAGLFSHVSPAMNTEWIPILAERIGTEVNPHIFLPCASLLLAAQEQTSRKALEDLIRKHEHLRDGWGGARLRELIKRHEADSARLLNQ